jgi:putative aldouronate transport system substrate-binding protein
MAMDAGLTSDHAPLIAFDFGAFNSRMEPFFFTAFGPGVDPGWANNGDGVVTFNRISDQYREFLRFFNRLHADGLFENEYLTMDRQTANARDRAGFSMVNTEFTTIVPEDFPGGEMALTQVPPLTSSLNSVRQTRASDIYRIGGGALNVNTDLAPAIARMFDLWFSRTDITGTSGIEAGSFIYGLRGRDWDIVDNGETLVLNIPEGVTLSHGNYVNTYVKLNHAFGYWNSLAMGGTPNALARQIGYVQNNIPYQVPYFPINEMKYTAAEMDIINMWGIDIELYAREMRARFIAGQSCLDNDWDEYVATIHRMGLAQLQEVYQAAYDRWNAILGGN